MRLISGIRSLSQPLPRSVVTIGNFDGVHMGHRQLLLRVRTEAERLSAESVVMTFQPHPRQVLFPEKPFVRLFPFEDQVRQFRELKMNWLIAEPFSRELSEIPPQKFLEDWIRTPLNPLKIVVGYDFSFGANRSGHFPLLEEWTKQNKISLEVIPPYEVGGRVVSSTLIREALYEGRVDRAFEWLGRPFYLQGIVVRGDQRGQKLGFPTANLSYEGEATPKTGVYSGWVAIQSKRYRAVTNVGRNPTFDLTATRLPRVEVHILDFQGDLYGTELRFEFDQHIRDEKRFASVEELSAQIRKDVEWARELK